MDLLNRLGCRVTMTEGGRGGPDGPAPRRIDRVTAAGFATDLAALPLPELRERRAEALAEESDLSYLRRMLHGRIDIIAAELTRRRRGDTSPLLSALTGILADPPPSRPASTRHLRLDGPLRDEPGEYRAEVEGRLNGLALPDLTGCPERDLANTARSLAACERELSGLRQQVQRVADRCAAELARRYRTGEAAVKDLLDDRS